MRVKNILGALCISVVASLCLLSISHWTRSDFLVRFLAENLAIIQITIIAINVPTVGIILTNLANIKKMNQQVWHNIKSTLTFSFYEQVAYLIVGLILTISCNGNALDGFWQLGLQLLQLSTLGMSIATLVDIFLSVVTVTEFIALNQSSEETNQE